VKRLITLILVILPFIVNAQLTRVAGGLGFSSGVTINTAETGNPAIWGRAYYKIAKRAYLTGTLSWYKTGVKSTFDEEVKNYMFHGDLDFQYGIFRDDPIRVVAFTGVNATTILSRYDIKVNTGQSGVEDVSEVKPGLNLGAALEMRVDNYFDAFVSAKYIVGTWDQMIVSIGVIYYLEENRRRSW